VSLYTISIRPDEAEDMEATLRVSLDRGRVRITEMTVRSAPVGGMLPATWPPSDIDVLLRSIIPAAVSPQAAVETIPDRSSVPAAAQRPATRRTAALKASSRGARRAKAPASAAKAATRTAKATQAGSQQRAYRRMPDDLAGVLAQVQTASGVASYYGVPRHTAKGWITRLRTMM
jgi:hypothetical protein